MIRANILHYDAVTSTNDVALDLAESGAPEGTVVASASQTRGRGRRGSSWYDEPGTNVLFSIILRPDAPVSDSHHQSFVTAVAAADCLREECGLDPLLKWPNDVLVRGKKIAGILTEASESATGSVVVVGIGLNVNQNEFPRGLAEIATSILLQTGREHDVETLCQQLVSRILAVYQAYTQRGFEDILAAWRKYMWGIGVKVRLVAQGRSLSGTILGVNSDGALRIRNESGKEYTLMAADMIMPQGRSGF